MHSDNMNKINNTSLLPSDWKLMELGSVLSFITDGVHNPPKRTINGIRLLAGATNIKYLNVDFTNCTYISKEDYDKIHRFYFIEANDILLTIVGTVGNVAIVKESDLPFSIQRSIALLRCGPLVYYTFLFYWLSSSEFKKKVYSYMNSSAQPGIYLGVIKQLQMPLPKLSEQKAIAKILSDLDSKIELNQKMNKTLETIAQAIFKHWFIDFEFPNEEGKAYKSSGGEMVHSELGKIPKGWAIRKIKDFCVSIENGGTPKRMEKRYWNGNINWFKTGELSDRPLLESEEKITEEGLRNSSCKLWKINTVLIALYASPTVGRMGILKVDGTSNQACSGLVARKEIGYSFLFYTLFFKREEFNRIAIGAAQQNIGQEIVKETLCIQPSRDLLDNFNSIADRLLQKQTMLAKDQATLSLLRDSIMPKLLSGKIRVPLEE